MSSLDGGRKRELPTRPLRPDPRKPRPARAAPGEGTAGNQNWLRRFTRQRPERTPAKMHAAPAATPSPQTEPPQAAPVPESAENGAQVDVLATARAPGPSAPPPPSAGATTPPGAGLPRGSLSIEQRIVDDAALPVPGAMRKTEFLEALQADVTTAAEDELARADRSIGDCPWIPYWFAFYQQRNVEHIARALVRYAPEAASASSLGEVISAVTRRVRDSVRRSLAAGRPIGVPAGVPAQVFNPLAPQHPPSSVPTLDPILNEPARDSAQQARPNDDAPQHTPFGDGGRPLETATRSRMESAFGTDFGGVRIHSGAQGQTAAGRMHARAVAFGSDVAFAPGQHRPGTPVGDALLAHELAHTLQQRESTPAARASTPISQSAEHRVEADADQAAGSALAAISGYGAGPIVPRQRAPLSIARCGAEDDLSVPKVVQVKAIRLFDSTRSPDPDIAFWNTNVQPHANMRMQKAGDVVLTEDRTEELIGPDHTLDTTSCGTTSEEDRLRSHLGSTTVIPAIFVKEIEGSNVGEQIHAGCGSRTVVVVEDADDGLSLSHESGHAMGLGHREKPGNLMQASGPVTDTALELDQARTIRSSSFAQ